MFRISSSFDRQRKAKLSCLELARLLIQTLVDIYNVAENPLHKEQVPSLYRPDCKLRGVMKTKSERYGRSQTYLQFKFAVQAHIQPWMNFWMSSCAFEPSEYRSKSFCAASSNVEIEFCRISTDLATAISRLPWRTYRRGSANRLGLASTKSKVS